MRKKKVGTRTLLRRKPEEEKVETITKLSLMKIESHSILTKDSDKDSEPLERTLSSTFEKEANSLPTRSIIGGREGRNPSQRYLFQKINQ